MNKIKIILTLGLFLICMPAFSQNIELIGYQLFPCNAKDMNNVHIYQKRIIEQKLKSDTLILMVTTVMNCCSGEKARVFLKNDTLNLISDYADSIPILNQKGDTIGWEETKMCDCVCCFSMEYKIKGFKDTCSVVTLNNEIIRLSSNKYLPPKYTIYKGDTLFYHDNNGFVYQYTYYESGNLKSVRKQKHPDYIWTFYYENGKTKSEIVFYKDFDHSIIKEYDETGNIIKYENNLKK